MIHKEKIIDSWLVLEARKGNKKALATLVKRWHKKLCRQAHWYTNDMELAKDISQECWPTIMKNLKNLKETTSFGSWALSIVTRKSIDVLRQKKREHIHLESYYKNHAIANDDDIPVDQENLVELLKQCIFQLPIQHQVVLNLFYLEELTIQKIGEIMELPEGTVKSRLFNSREKLKLILKNRNHEE